MRLTTIAIVSRAPDASGPNPTWTTNLADSCGCDYDNKNMRKIAITGLDACAMASMTYTLIHWCVVLDAHRRLT
jgi:hypothetical protein